MNANERTDTAARPVDLRNGCERDWEQERECFTRRPTDPTPGTPKTEFERRFGMTSTIVQIAAIVIGGIFAIVKFGLIDAPPLQESFNVSGSLDWAAAHDGSSCIASMQVVVTNNSKSKINVSKVRGRAWYLNEPPPANKPIQHFDFIDFSRKTPPQDEVVSLDGPLVQNYVPGESSTT